MSKEFKVGDEVAVIGGFAHEVVAIRKINAISPKRGDITVEKTDRKFNSFGSEIGEGSSYHRWSIEIATPKHKAELKHRIIMRKINEVKLHPEEITLEEAERIWEVLKPIWEKQHASPDKQD